MSNLKKTKLKLAFIFASLVFAITTSLVLIFFSLKFVNFTKNEKQDFLKMTQVFTQEFRNNESEFLNSIQEMKNIRPFIENKDNKRERENGKGVPPNVRFVNFFVTDTNNNVVLQNVREEIDVSISVQKIPSETLTRESEYFIIKYPIKTKKYNEIIFIKKQSYSLEDYLEDMVFFIAINVIFSIVFYIIGYIFVNQNLKPVEEILEDMKDFIHNAHHELKTPIAIISSNLQMIKAMKTYEEDLLVSSVDEIKRLDELLNGLSDLSNINSTQSTQNLNVPNEIQEIVGELSSVWKQKNIRIDIKNEHPLDVEANKQYFYILFSNLLRNAIKYNFENGKIIISIKKNYFSIANTGTMIPENDREKIFDRFFQCDTSRNTEGFGIGLSLVKKICDTYQWKINVDSNQNYTTFEIHI